MCMYLGQAMCAVSDRVLRTPPPVPPPRLERGESDWRKQTGNTGDPKSFLKKVIKYSQSEGKKGLPSPVVAHSGSLQHPRMAFNSENEGQN